jgi:hypothetical protein
MSTKNSEETNLICELINDQKTSYISTDTQDFDHSEIHKMHMKLGHRHNRYINFDFNSLEIFKSPEMFPWNIDITELQKQRL